MVMERKKKIYLKAKVFDVFGYFISIKERRIYNETT